MSRKSLAPLLAERIDKARFQEVYHDPGLKVVEVAEILGTSVPSLTRLARQFELPTRQEAGLCYRRNEQNGNSEEKAFFSRNSCCDPDQCLFWEKCTSEKLWLSGVLCEKFFFFFERPGLVESRSELPGQSPARVTIARNGK